MPTHHVQGLYREPFAHRECEVCCPLCETQFIIPQDDVSKLLTAFFVANMIYVTELLKQEGKGCGSCGSMTTTCAAVAATFCVDGASFLCMDSHLLMKGLKDHKVLEIKKVESMLSLYQNVGSCLLQAHFKKVGKFE